VSRWSVASQLPPLVADIWRDPSRWDQLAAPGNRYLELPGFLAPSAAAALREAVIALPMVRLTTDLLDADRRLLAGGEIAAWLDLLQTDALRALVSELLGRAMPRGVVVNAWRLGRGDFMGVHPDGPLYRGTISLGLCSAWTAEDGGAIAFGDRDGEAFTVHQRWFPHLGDACMFAPDVDTWHCVEPVRTDVVRHSLTGWWTEPEDGLTRGRS
jgi:2-oxoglutarate-Fe(II)-dependent oxygenase superfamily protein